MPAYYTIVQYVPDAIADERINIGVIVYGAGVVRSRFLHNWSRVRAFGDSDAKFLRRFAEQVSATTGPGTQPLFELPGLKRLDEAALQQIIGDWSQSIQFTRPAGSLLDPDDLLKESADRYLRDRPRQRREFRDRRHAAGLALKSVQGALQEILGPESRKYVRRQFQIPGRLVQHQFDVALRNGRVYSVIDGLSFEVPDRTELLRDVDATAWAIDDVKRADATVEAAVLALSPRSHSSKAFRRAEDTFKGLGAEFLTERDVDAWSHALAQRFAERAVQET